MVYPIPAFAEPPTIVSASTVTELFATSISNTWFLIGTISFEFGLTVTSITVEATPLTFSMLDTFKEFTSTLPVE